MDAISARGARGRLSFWFFNLAQSFSVLNDHLFKSGVTFFLIAAFGAEHANLVVTSIGALYVIPFLLFSSIAGEVADCYSKQKILLTMKGFEAAIMLVALIAFACDIVGIHYFLIFLLALHSAFFSPSKYGIIPEIVTNQDKIASANGTITGTTYLSIIFGTFGAACISHFCTNAFFVITLLCLGVAVVGFVLALGIPKTVARSSRQMTYSFLAEDVWKTLKSAAQKKGARLLLSIMGSALFLFLGTFVQLNIIPFTIETLHLPDTIGGMLFLVTAFGIGLGSWLVGKLAARYDMNFIFSCAGLLGVSTCLLALGFINKNVAGTVVDLFFLGFFAGVYVVPLDTFIQMNSDEDKRGKTIAATNFLGFLGVLVASLVLFLLQDLAGLRAATCFGLLGMITAAIAGLFLLRCSDISLFCLCRGVLKLFAPEDVSSDFVSNITSQRVLILNKLSLKELVCLLSVSPHIHLFFPSSRFTIIRWITRWIYSFHMIPHHAGWVRMIADTEESPQGISCFVLNDSLRKSLMSEMNAQGEPPSFSLAAYLK